MSSRNKEMNEHTHTQTHETKKKKNFSHQKLTRLREWSHLFIIIIFSWNAQHQQTQRLIRFLPVKIIIILFIYLHWDFEKLIVSDVCIQNAIFIVCVCVRCIQTLINPSYSYSGDSAACIERRSCTVYIHEWDIHGMAGSTYETQWEY